MLVPLIKVNVTGFGAIIVWDRVLSVELLLTLGFSLFFLVFSDSSEDFFEVLSPSLALVLGPVVGFLIVDDTMPLSLPLSPDLLRVLL